MAEANSHLTHAATLPLHEETLAAFSGPEIETGTPEYLSLRHAMIGAANKLVAPGSRVLDLQCNDGRWIAPFVENFGGICRFVALSPDPDHRQSCMDRFRSDARQGSMEIGCLDINEDFPAVSARVVLSAFALSKMSSERRLEVLRSVRKRVEKEGALILVEKVSSGHEGNSKGLSSGQWEGSLAEAGFKRVEVIWRRGPFVAWAATR